MRINLRRLLITNTMLYIHWSNLINDILQKKKKKCSSEAFREKLKPPNLAAGYETVGSRYSRRRHADTAAAPVGARLQTDRYYFTRSQKKKKKPFLFLLPIFPSTANARACTSHVRIIALHAHVRRSCNILFHSYFRGFFFFGYVYH